MSETPTEKPLHVQVAEALGWTEINAALGTGYPPSGPINGNARRPAGEAPRLGAAKVPRYDLDWSATGPLIERYRPHMQEFGEGWEASKHLGTYVYGPVLHAQGNTLRLAVCNLILALKEAGKL